MIFLDIDDNLAGALEHLMEHAQSWIRSSVNDHLHAIVEDECPACSAFSDANFTGNTLFDNHGHNWCSPIWTNVQTKRQQIFGSVALIHVITTETDTVELRHFQFDSFEKVRKHIGVILTEHETVYYTFHVAHIRNIKELDFDKNIYNDANVGRDIQYYMQEYRMEQYLDLADLWHQYVEFDESIPAGFVYRSLRLND
jgi:hypothetical protein